MLENYEDVLDIKDMCRILKISRKTAYKLLLTDQIPYRRIGRNYKISKRALIDFLEENR